MDKDTGRIAKVSDEEYRRMMEVMGDQDGPDPQVVPIPQKDVARLVRANKERRKAWAKGQLKRRKGRRAQRDARRGNRH